MIMVLNTRGYIMSLYVHVHVEGFHKWELIKKETSGQNNKKLAISAKSWRKKFKWLLKYQTKWTLRGSGARDTKYAQQRLRNSLSWGNKGRVQEQSGSTGGARPERWALQRLGLIQYSIHQGIWGNYISQGKKRGEHSSSRSLWITPGSQSQNEKLNFTNKGQSYMPCLSSGNKHHTTGVSDHRAKPGTVELFASDKAVPRAKIKNIERSTEISNPQQNKTSQSNIQ